MNDKTEVKPLTGEDAIALRGASMIFGVEHLADKCNAIASGDHVVISAADLKAKDAEIESLKFDLHSAKARINSKTALLDAIRAVCNERHSDLGIPAYIESLRRDAERLEFICMNMRGIESRRLVGGLSNTGDMSVWRAAIDAAMQGDKSNGI